jgi:hypothetical protein
VWQTVKPDGRPGKSNPSVDAWFQAFCERSGLAFETVSNAMSFVESTAVKLDIPYQLTVKGAKPRQLAPVGPALALLAAHDETRDICDTYVLRLRGICPEDHPRLAG